MNRILFTTCLLALFAIASAEHWAVLVAGSDGYWNYRHQSDVCHSYQILIRNGFKPSNIIVFAKDDIANSPFNPFKGQIFNKPDHTGPGVDVNKGCLKDYTGNTVKPKHFISVLKGDAAAVKNVGTGRVLQSGPDDHVFIYFSDHGAPGLIAFPDEYLYAKDLNPVWNFMYQARMYKRLVFYLEACESGSMFLQLPKNINIYAVSAANPTESSWAYYCDDNVVNGKSIDSCLGDEFSIQFLEDSDAQDLFKETLQRQFEHVRDWTKQSHVMQWGDTTWTDDIVGNYQGNPDINMTSHVRRQRFNQVRRERPQGQAVDSRDVKLHYLMKKHLRSNSEESERELQEELNERAYFKDLFTSLMPIFELSQEEVDTLEGVENWECYENAINSIERRCRKLSDYGLKFLRIVAAACNKFPTVDHVSQVVETQLCFPTQLESIL